MNYARLDSIILIILFLFTFSACEKEKVYDIPVVEIHNPSENQHFSVGDTIQIWATISSKSNIQSVDIDLVDENLKPISKNYVYTSLNGKTNGDLRFAIILSDPFQTSGQYQILIRVVNEEDTKHKYKKITISGLDKEWLGAALITKAPNKINVWNYDLDFNKTIKKVMIGDYSGSVYLPFHNRMALSAKIQGSYTIWDYLSGDTVLHFQAKANPPFPYFTGVGMVDQKITAQYYAGAFSLYNYMGKLTNSISAESGFYIEKVFDVGNNFISYQKEKYASPEMRLVTHIGGSGLNWSFVPVQGPVIAAFPLEGNNFLLFSNYNSTGQIEKYFWDKNATNHPVSFPSDEFIDVASYLPDEYLLLTNNQVYRYRYGAASITPLINLNGVVPINIRYEIISQRIWVVDKQGFTIYNPLGQKIADYRVNEEVLNLHLIYNL